MAEKTGITWCHHTFNAIWGCMKVSAGCANCYASDLAARYGFNVWGPAVNTGRRTFGEKHWHEPLLWNAKAEKAGERRRVFCSSMADVFEDHPTVIAETAKLWPLIEATPWLDWLLLTKRPERIREMVPAHWLTKPRHNVWFGTSAEHQAAANERIPHLLRVPAVVRFVSAEPLLGPLDLRAWIEPRFVERPAGWIGGHNMYETPRDIHWVIAGGESGPTHRPMLAEWARQLRDDCRVNGVAFFFKQWGGKKSYSGGDLLDDEQWHQFPTVAAMGQTALPLVVGS